MITRFFITAFILLLANTYAFAGDTLRVDLLKLEKIDIDTLSFVETDKFLGCYTLTFQKEQNKKIKVSFVNMGSLKSKAIIYAWENGNSSRNFSFGIGLYYKIGLVKNCLAELENDSYYYKNADFGQDGCTLIKAFNHTKYKNDFSIKKTHYLHLENSVYKVLWFSPTQVVNTVQPKANIGFLPLNLKYNK